MTCRVLDTNIPRRFNEQAMPPHPGNNTAVPPCPEAGHTGSSPFQGSPGNDGASEVQAITPGVRPTFHVLKWPKHRLI
jgi:hypothetical protein